MNLKLNWYKWVAILALVLAGVVSTVVAVKLAPPREAAVGRTTTTYYVTNGSNNFIVNGTIYTVTNGQVALTDSDYAYYKPLVDAGILRQTSANAGVFLNADLIRIGAGASADLQAGSYVTMNGTIAGLPTFVGPVTSTGGFVGNVAGNLTGNAASSYVTSTNVISMAGATFTGPIKYGTAAAYTSGAPISHGFAATPTMCLLIPARDVTSTLTITSTMFSSNRATVAEVIYWMCGK